MFPTVRKLFVIIGLFSVLAASAEPLDPRHEIGLGTSPLLGLGARTTGADLYTDLSNNTLISANVDYDVALFRYLQLGVSSALGLADTGTGSFTVLQAVGGPTFNLPFGDDWLHNSLFIGGKFGFGMVDTSVTNGTSKLMFTGDIGYRLSLARNVTWRPTISTVKVLDGSKFLFAVRLVSFSFVF